MWTLITRIVSLGMLICLVHSWEPRIYVRDAQYEEAKKYCLSKNMFLPGNLEYEEQNSLLQFMKKKNVEDVWLSLTRRDYSAFKPVTPYNGKPDVTGHNTGRKCLAIRLPESNKKPEVKALRCSVELPALCETSCDWCPQYKCRRTQRGCMKLVLDKMTWGNAKAECLQSGGRLWVNGTYNLRDIGWSDIQKYVNPLELWVGWRNVDWAFDKESEKNKSPIVLNFKNPSGDGDCTIQTLSSGQWRMVSCISKSTAVCGLAGKSPHTGSSPATTSPEEEMNADERCPFLKTKYFIIFLTAGVTCCCVSMLSIGCCIRLAMRVRGQNKLMNNHGCHGNERADVNGKGLLATIRRSARGLSQIYSEIFYSPSDTVRNGHGNARSLPRTPADPGSSNSKLPIKETVPEQWCEPYPERRHGSDVSVYVKQKQTVGLKHETLPREFEHVKKETMFVENNPVYTSY